MAQDAVVDMVEDAVGDASGDVSGNSSGEDIEEIAEASNDSDSEARPTKRRGRVNAHFYLMALLLTCFSTSNVVSLV